MGCSGGDSYLNTQENYANKELNLPDTQQLVNYCCVILCSMSAVPKTFSLA